MGDRFYYRNGLGGKVYICSRRVGDIIPLGPDTSEKVTDIAGIIVEKLNNAPLSIQIAELDPRGYWAGIYKLIVQWIIEERANS